jgi:hypothetical protein
VTAGARQFAAGDEITIEAERSVLGCCLLYPEAVEDCASLQPSDFFLPKHGAIFRAVVTAYRGTGQTDPTTVGAELDRHPGALDAAGGHVQLVDLMEGVITPAGVSQHVEIVRERSTRRRTERLLQTASDRLAEGASIDDVRALAARVTEPDGWEPQPTTCARVRPYVEFMQQPSFRWRMAGWLPVQGTAVLGAAQHTGKTVVCVDWAHRCLLGDAVPPWCGHEVRQPCSSLYVVGEDALGVMLRCNAFVRERVTGGLAEAFASTGYVDGRTIEFVDRMPALSTPSGIDELEQLIVDFEKKHGHLPGIVWLDTLATLFGEDENDNAELGRLAKELGRLADKYGLLIVVVHHLRKSGDRKNPKPTASELRGGSVLGGDFDIVWLLWQKDEADRLSPVEVYCDKGKNGGGTGTSHHLQSRWVVLGTNEDGDEVGAPLLVPVDAPSARSEDDEHAEQVGNVQRIAYRMVAALRAPDNPGWVRSKTQAELLTVGRRKDKSLAFDWLVGKGWLTDKGSARSPRFELTDLAPSLAAVSQMVAA